jgi:hypothetical protein
MRSDEPDYDMSDQSDVLALQRAATVEGATAADTMKMDELSHTEPRELGEKCFNDRISYDNLFVSDRVTAKRVWVDAFETAFRKSRRRRKPSKSTLEGWADGM